MLRPLRFVRDWLERVPVSDPLDRRNASVMQLLLLFIGFMLPLNWAYHLFVIGMAPWRGRDVLMTADFATAIAALAGFLLIRRGYFRQAIVLFLGVLLLGLAASAMAIGFLMLMFDQTASVISLVIGGLVLGRRALWVTLAVLFAVFAIGMNADAVALVALGKPSGAAFGNGPSVCLSYLVITIIIDRCAAALRESLVESNERGRQLQSEMAERERAQGQLVHAQKMEAVGRVASGVAHDFDNVLGVILGYASRRERLADSGPVALLDALEGVELAARRASAISRKLLTFSRNDVTTPETFDAAVATTELAPMLRQLFGPEVRVEVRAPDGQRLPVRMDRGQFELVVLNIAANARDAMPDGGQFDIELSMAARHVVLALRDDGMGMAQDICDRVFEPFFTTKPRGCGTGLGLGVVRDLVEGAGGDVTVASDVGQGTVFHLRLPLVGV
jgi:signal transduction histidine kinase